MKGFIKFNKGVMKMPKGWQAWLMLLMSVNMVAPLFFLGHLEAQMTLAAFMINVTLFAVMTGRYGFTRLLGLGHLPWVPLVGFLAMRLGDIPADDPFGIWLRALIALNVVSLIIDAIDVARYMGGDRAETVDGL